jgi:hypothetical protein
MLPPPILIGGSGSAKATLRFPAEQHRKKQTRMMTNFTDTFDMMHLHRLLNKFNFSGDPEPALLLSDNHAKPIQSQNTPMEYRFSTIIQNHAVQIKALRR